MEPHPYGWLSVAPPLVAIVLAIATRRAALSLIAGIFCGALLTNHGNPFGAVYDTLEVHLWPTVTDPGKLRVFSFTLLMGATIGVICRSGGMLGLISLISPLARTRRGGQLTTWGLGMIIFFDDYANTILLGGTLRPVCDRLRISREKLAYLVDSTAAPVAALSLLSTWVAVEIDYIRSGIETLPAGSGVTAIDLFLGSIPFRFYILMSLAFIFILAWTGRDFGPMLAAEKERLKTDHPPESVSSGTAALDQDLASVQPAHWAHAIVPIVVTLGTVMALLYTTGKQAMMEVLPDGDFGIREILGAAASSFSLQYGALAGLTTAVLMGRVAGVLDRHAVLDAAAKGARVVLPAIAILWTASALSRLTSDKSYEGEPSTTAYQFKDHRLYTGVFLTGILTDGEAPTESGTLSTTAKLMPTVVFLLAAALSFSTGTSFGTMGILLPMVVALTYSLLAAGGVTNTAENPILLASVGAVLAGAVFGDHCSPISDTTILSSQSCACDHIAHVVTQLPYAATVAVVSILCGTLPLGWGVSVWLLLPLQLAALCVCVALLGSRAEDLAEAAA
ncbi:MAG: Na+/H+ antiporter NhaC family protein [Planctomycetota bacterium]